MWIGEGEFVARAIDKSSWSVEAFVSETEVTRLAGATKGYFFSQDGVSDDIPVEIVEIDPTPVGELPPSPLLSTFGGALRVKQTNNDGFLPLEPYYRVRLAASWKAEGEFPIQHFGRAVLSAPARSIAAGWGRDVLQFLRRELAF